jgi:transposase-like protein
MPDIPTPARGQISEVDRAYYIWATTARHNVAEVARKMGKPRSTITYWRDHHRWRQRYRDDHGENAKELSQYEQARFAAALDRGINRVIKVIDDPEAAHRDALNAYKLFRESLFPQEVVVSHTTNMFDTQVLALLQEKDRKLTPQEKLQVLQAATETNILEAEVSRKRGKRGS